MQNCLLIFIIVITIVMNIIFANGHVYVQNIKQMQLKLHERYCALKKEIGTYKNFTENWDSKALSVGTLLAYLETTA